MQVFNHFCLLTFASFNNKHTHVLQTQKINGEWRDLTEECSEEVRQSSQHTSYDLNDLQPDTTYKIELRARNAIGHSSPAQIKIRTARGENDHYYSYSYSGACYITFTIVLVFAGVANTFFVQFYI